MYSMDQLTNDLKNSLGDHLLGVVLYGSSVSKNKTKNYSKENILVLVDNITAERLKIIIPFIKKWRKVGHPAPLVLTEDTFSHSMDVFPLEYLDMKAHHLVLWGPDPLDKLQVDKTHLQHQVEFELRSKVIQLRQRFLELEAKPRELKELMARSISSITVLLKGMLWLSGQTPPMHRREVWADVSELVSMDIEVFEKIIDIRDGKREAKSYDADELFERFHATLQQAVGWVDQFGQKNKGGVK